MYNSKVEVRTTASCYHYNYNHKVDPKVGPNTYHYYYYTHFNCPKKGIKPN